MTQASLELSGTAARRFESYLDATAGALGHADRVEPARAYCTGLLLPGERKSIEPMAARLAPHRAQAAHQSLHHLVARAAWRDEAVLAVVRSHVLPAIERHGPLTYWSVDDTGLPKKGRHSVGVARQYCGQLGKQDNCQVAVTLSVANDEASLPIAYRLYLPQRWASDPERRAKAGVPAAVKFRTKPQIALEQLAAARAAGVPPGIVLADVAYGNDTGFRDGVSTLDLRYAVGVQASTTVWAPGTEPLPPASTPGRRGRPQTRLQRAPGHRPVTVKALAEALPAQAFRTVTWREDSGGGARRSRFAARRVRPAHRDERRTLPREEQWLLIEWPRGEAEPSKYWLSTLPAGTRLADLVAAAKGRWRIERDYQELKQEIGLGHHEGRGWRGFHHHATLCIAAYGFLIAERCRFPPEERFKPDDLAAPAPPAGFQPRGAGAPGAP